LSRFVAKFACILNAPSVVVNSGRDKNATTTTPMDKQSPPDIPPVGDRHRFKKLTPDEEQEFLREQAVYAAAYSRWNDPVAPWEALRHVERSRQTVPHWLSMALYETIVRGMTPDDVRRSRERWQFARRYTLVCNYRARVDERTGRKISEDRAVDLAISDLREEGDEGEFATIKNTYRRIRTDLKQRGRKSEWYYYVPEGY
jgi:hypothetical protein